MTSDNPYVAQGYSYVDSEHITDVSTGECIDAFPVIVPTGSKIITPKVQEIIQLRKEQEAVKQLRRTNTDPLGSFLFMFSKKNYSNISSQNLARLVFLSTYLSFGSCEIRWHKNKPIRKNELESLLGLSTATCFRFWKDVEGKYLYETEDKTICFCKSFIKGQLPKSYEYLAYQKIYIKSIRSLYKKVPVSKHKYLGYVFQMLPYINSEFNILCYNPDEEILDSIIPLTLNDFCEEIGISPEQRSRFVKTYSEIKFAVEDHEEAFCAFVTDGSHFGNCKIFVNPRILYNGTCWESVEILNVFTKPDISSGPTA